MKAVTWSAYGGPEVLKCVEGHNIPTITKSDQVKIRVMAASPHPGDHHVMRADPSVLRLMFGLVRPRLATSVFGMNNSGIVEEVGSGVRDFKAGDQVYADSFGLGAFAEYCVVPEKSAAKKPSNATFGEAAALGTSACTALKAVRDTAKVSTGQRVLINGASGGVGHYAVQLAKHYGAHVTAVASGKNEELLRSLGADEFIDYTKIDYTSASEEYDAIIDCNRQQSFPAIERTLASGGKYIFIGGGAIMPVLKASMTRSKVSMLAYSTDRKVMDAVTELFEQGALKSHIDAVGEFHLEDTAAAMVHMHEGHPCGKVVIKVSKNADARL